MTIGVAASPALGANLRGHDCDFRVWAPRAHRLAIRLLGRGDFPMRPTGDGYFTLTLPAAADDRYFYIVDDGQLLPDPVSRLLPEGVHGPTAILDPDSFPWSEDNWRGLDLRDYILYELHAGTFTPEGTFDGVISRLDYLRSLGISVIELMPVSAFPGARNWGYDGASPFAVHAGYGGPDGLKRLVAAAHRAGLGVVLDVVYNHLGPEGNYLAQFGPYFTDRHHTPWGGAVNYDGGDAAPVRRYFVENALYWLREYHLDGLRLDATQTIHDDSPRHIVQEIADNTHALARELNRPLCVICETDENDARYLLPPPGGFGADAVWSDDFHHALHTLLTRESRGYYQDFGRGEQLARALGQGFVFQGEPFKFWDGRRRGTPVAGVPLYRHVICAQNHDQVGNRALGERLTALVPRGARKLAAALLLLAPETPLLFMGEEYDEQAPFQFFADFGDPALRQAVTQGRRREFSEFQWNDVPDPHDPATFERSRLRWPIEQPSAVAAPPLSLPALSGGPPLSRPGEPALSEVEGARQGGDVPDPTNYSDMLSWYRFLLDLRRKAIIPGERTCRAEWHDGILVMQVPREHPRVMVVAEFPGNRAAHDPGAAWNRILHADEDGYRATIYQRD
jgi:maltooligosyltrehalose trehalohydrolase